MWMEFSFATSLIRCARYPSPFAITTGAFERSDDTMLVGILNILLDAQFLDSSGVEFTKIHDNNLVFEHFHHLVDRRLALDEDNDSRSIVFIEVHTLVVDLDETTD